MLMNIGEIAWNKELKLKLLDNILGLINIFKTNLVHIKKLSSSNG